MNNAAQSKPPSTIIEQSACLSREIKLRDRVYPRRIMKGHMTQDLADREIIRMNDAWETLQVVEKIVKAWHGQHDGENKQLLSLRHLSIGKQREFVAVFLEQLYHFKGEPGKQTPLLVVVDECSTFCPQSIRKGSEGGYEARCLGACETLVRRGRSSGFGFVAVDQRPASINKDVLTQLELLIVHRVTSPQDRDALNDWVKGHDTDGSAKEMFGSVASLTLGQCWAWSPGMDLFQLTQIRERETFDSSKTPKIGETVLDPTAFAMIDVEGFRSVLETSREDAKRKDPKWMEKRIQDLELQIENGLESEAIENAEALRQENISLRGEVSAANLILLKVRDLLAKAPVYTVADATELIVEEHIAKPMMQDGPIPEAVILGGSDMVRAEQPNFTPSKAPLLSPDDFDRISGPQQRILNALRSFEPLNMAECPKNVVALFAEASPRSSSFSNNLGSLRARGLIDYPRSGYVSLTPAGRAIAAKPLGVPTLVAFHQGWINKLSSPQQKIIRTLIGVHPNSMSKEALATETGASLTSSAFSNNLGFLRNSLGLIDYPSPGLVKATDLLFPKGLK